MSKIVLFAPANSCDLTDSIWLLMILHNHFTTAAEPHTTGNCEGFNVILDLL